MTLKERIKKLANSEGLSIPKLEEELGFGGGTISRWDKSAPSADKLAKIAERYNVTVDYLLGRELTPRDEKDIAKRLEQALSDLESSQEGLMFSGEPLDDETRELLKVSLENSIRIAKINAKQKYTPKKYRKDQ